MRLRGGVLDNCNVSLRKIELNRWRRKGNQLAVTKNEIEMNKRGEEKIIRKKKIPITTKNHQWKTRKSKKREEDNKKNENVENNIVNNQEKTIEYPCGTCNEDAIFRHRKLKWI